MGGIKVERRHFIVQINLLNEQKNIFQPSTYLSFYLRVAHCFDWIYHDWQKVSNLNFIFRKWIFVCFPHYFWVLMGISTYSETCHPSWITYFNISWTQFTMCIVISSRFPSDNQGYCNRGVAFSSLPLLALIYRDQLIGTGYRWRATFLCW